MSKKTELTEASKQKHQRQVHRDARCCKPFIKIFNVEIIELTMKHFIALTLAVIGCVFAPQTLFADVRIWQNQQPQEPQPAVLRGRVWDDANHDGIRQDTERGYSGLTVTLYTGRVQIVATAITSATGEYEFTNLQALSYTVGFALPKDYSFTLPLSSQATASTDSNVNANGLTDEIAIGAGDELVNIDAGIWRSSLVSEEPPTLQTYSVFLPMVNNGK
jgi:hypothetical protein